MRKALRDFTKSRTVLLIYFLLFILLLIASFIVIKDTATISRRYNVIVDTSMYKIRLMRENRLGVEQIQSFIIDKVFHPESLKDSDQLQTQQNLSKIQSSFEEFSRLVSSKKEDSLFHEVINSWDNYEQSKRKFITLRSDEKSAISFYNSEEKIAYNDFYKATNKLSLFVYDSIKEEDDIIDRFTFYSQIKIQSLIAAIVILLLVLGFLVVRNVKKINQQHKSLIIKDRELQASESLYRNLFDKSPLPKWVCDRSTLQIYEVNDAAIKLYGYTKEEFLNLTVFDIRPKEDHEKLKKFIKAKDFTSKNYGVRKHIKKDGGIIWAEIGLDDILYKGKESILVVIHDVTEKLKTQEELRNSESLYRSLFNNSPVFVWVCDLPTLTNLEVNETALNHYGYSKEEFLSMTAYDLLPEEDREQLKQRIQGPENSGFHGYDRHVKRNGDMINVEIRVQTINYKGKAAGLVIGTDVTEKLRIEERIKREQDFYKSITENSSDVEIVTTKEGKITFVSSSVVKIFGLTKEEMVGKTSKEFWHPDDFKRNKEKISELIKNPGAFIQLEARCLDKSNNYRWCEARISNQLDNPNIKGFVSNYSEITERKLAEEKVITSEKLYHSLFDKNPLPIFVVDKNGLKFLEINNTAIDLYGYSREEFLEMTVFDLRFKEDHLSLKEMMNAELMGALKNYTVKHIKKNGEKIIVDVTIENIYYKGKMAHLGIIRDITKTLQLQKQLNEEKISHQKEITRATIDGQEKERGELGKELHDNVNQILACAKLYLSSAGKAATEKKDQLIEESKGLIDSGIQEIRKLSKSLVPPSLAKSTLKESIEELIDPLRITTDKKIETIFSIPDESILCDKIKLTIYRMIQEQMNNIVKYAEASKIRIILKQDNYKLLLQVKDNGKGFDVKAKRKGIGLTNISNRAEIYNGKVVIDSAPGNGCTLSVFFPLEHLQNAEKSGNGIVSMSAPGMAS